VDLAHLAPQVKKVKLDNLDLKALKAQLEQLDYQAHKDSKVLKAAPEVLELMAHQEHKAHQEFKEPLVNKAHKDFRVHKDHKDQMDQMDLKEHLAHKGPLVLKDPLDLPELSVLKVLKDLELHALQKLLRVQAHPVPSALLFAPLLMWQLVVVLIAPQILIFNSLSLLLVLIKRHQLDGRDFATMARVEVLSPAVPPASLCILLILPTLKLMTLILQLQLPR